VASAKKHIFKIPLLKIKLSQKIIFIQLSTLEYPFTILPNSLGLFLYSPTHLTLFVDYYNLIN
jgi:hypothetical protein